MTELTAPQTAGPRLDPGEAGVFLRELGLELDEVSGSRVTAHLELAPRHHTPWGIVHGGVYTTVVESVASIGASMHVRDKGQVAVGLTNTTHFLRPVTAGRAHIVAVPLSQGRTQQLWQVDITDGLGKLIEKGELRVQNVEGAAHA